MKMNPFEYVLADSAREAGEELRKSGGKLIAGGTDLLGTILGGIHPVPADRLIALRNAGLSYICEEETYLRVGAMTTLSGLGKDRTIKEKAPLLAQAARAVATSQIRNVATVGGNICQEPRCWYYRYPDNQFHCLRKGGAVCNAFTGNNLYHSVFGTEKVCAAACERGCPNGTDIPAYMEKIRGGDLRGAAEILFRVNPLAAVTGRVCPHNCQSECSRGAFDEATAIRGVERFLGDLILKEAAEFMTPPAEERPERAAVVGSGPAGLTAAYYLRSGGMQVTVFDRNEKPGGMLTYGIPAYRLPKEVIETIVQRLEAMGVKFVLGCEVRAGAGRGDGTRAGGEAGTDVNSEAATGAGRCGGETAAGSEAGTGDDREAATDAGDSGGESAAGSAAGDDAGLAMASAVALESLQKKYDYVFLACGAWGNAAVGMENERLTMSGLDFLRAVSRRTQKKPGDAVLVIGGGNVAMDAAISAKRLGARKVTVVYRRSRELMPANPWEVAQALEEGVELKTSAAPLAIVEEKGRLRGLKVVESISGKDRTAATELDYSRQELLEADCVILAIGQTIEDSAFRGVVETGRGNRIAAEEETGKTSRPGIYAGGDVVRGPATVAEAIADGRRAADRILKELGIEAETAAGAAAGLVDGGAGPAPGAAAVGKTGRSRETRFDASCLEASRPEPMPMRAPQERELYREDELGLQEASLFKEAQRCFNCGCAAVSVSDLAPALIALEATVVTTEREIPAGNFFAAGVGSSTVLRPGEVAVEVRIPKSGKPGFQIYEKFRQRKSIDFPVIAVAANIRLEGKTVAKAKLVLSAVRPTPFESSEAEAYLTGKELNAENAEKAAEISLRSAVPLQANQYKVKVAKALIKRTLLAAADWTE